ncbi:hypothetical protein BOH72_23440 [Mycobacterium sp. WY10]|nr:hypothetical protein BOH72_23440 [Mycobacterium sp. WY10]
MSNVRSPARSTRKGIILGAAEVVQLGCEIQANYPGQGPPDLHSRDTCLAYFGDHPDMVGFELAMILAARCAEAACGAGYAYGPADIVEELRTFIRQIGEPRTEAVGRQLLYYWPNVAVRGAS